MIRRTGFLMIRGWRGGHRQHHHQQQHHDGQSCFSSRMSTKMPASEDDHDEDEADDDFVIEGITGEDDAEVEKTHQAERAAVVKALLDPAWMHGRRRIDAPPQEGIDRMNELSKLLSGKQIRLHAGRLARGREILPQQQQVKGNRGKAASNADKIELVDDMGDEELLRGVVEEDEEKGEDDEQEEEEEEEEEEEVDAGHLLDRRKPLASSSRPTWTGRVASPPEALAYLSTRAIPNFSINLRVLREVATDQQRRGKEGKAPQSILDVGCGPGSGLLAAQSIWPDITRMEGVDHSGAMRDLARHLLDMPHLPVHRHLPPLASQVERSGQKYDIIFSSWTLSELESDATRALAMAIMWEMVEEEGGYLVLIEDGSPEGSRIVRSARKMLLEEEAKRSRTGEDEEENKGIGGHTIAPCPHDRPCPLIRQDWCRFSQRVPIGRIKKGVSKRPNSSSGSSAGGGGIGVSYKDVAFSYIIMKKGAPPPDSDVLSDDRIQALRRLRRAGESEGQEESYQPQDQDWDAANEDPSLERSQWGRLIRSPRKAKGHILIDLCTPGGSLERLIVSKGRSKTLPGKFLAARKAQWGGLWPVSEM